MIIIILYEINMPLAKLVRIVQHIVMIRNKILCICLFIFSDSVSPFLMVWDEWKNIKTNLKKRFILLKFVLMFLCILQDVISSSSCGIQLPLQCPCGTCRWRSFRSESGWRPLPSRSPSIRSWYRGYVQSRWWLEYYLHDEPPMASCQMLWWSPFLQPGKQGEWLGIHNLHHRALE